MSETTVDAEDTPKSHFKPLRIALLGYRSNPFSGGQGIYLKYVSRALKDIGHHVDVISGEPYPDLDDDISLIKLPGLNLYDKQDPLRALKLKHLGSATDLFEWWSMNSGGFPEPYTFGQRAKKYLLKHHHQYDIIHDNQSLSYGVLALQRKGLAVTTTIHHPITFDLDIALAHTPNRGARLMIKRWHHFLNMQTRVAKRLHHITTVSECAKRDIASAFGVNQAKIKMIHNGVDSHTFKPLPHIKRASHHLITTASADQPLKGTQYLIPAIAQLKQQYPQLRLTFIGKPKSGGHTAKLITDLALNDTIDFKHGIAPEEIVRLYATATIAVVPSQYEGFGLPAAEAMACAVPVVATDGGALPEVVGDAGITVPKGNPNALARAIAKLLDNPERRQAYAEAGRLRMTTTFNWKLTAERLSHYYQDVVLNGPRI
ncbi:MAG: glycosyltransferase family 4 protein [Pseudomonadales bacterium]|nr:glycosyltransferase family 4 protein [Pseudomonadales bacterium]